MDGNGFTGLNEEKAKQDIFEFEMAMRHIIYSVFCSANEQLYDELDHFWCSPNAVMFGELYYKKYSEGFSVLSTLSATIIANSQRAYNRLAQANNLPLIDVYYRFQNNPYDSGPGGQYNMHIEHPLREKNEFGRSGMNKMQVRESLKIYNAKMREVIDGLDNLPTTIAFYDDNGDMQAAFSNLITQCKSKVVSIVEEITSTINSKMEEEIDNILLAKVNATNEMRA